MLKIEKLTFGYDEAPVLRDVNLTVDGGEILLIEGENGAGKTTLLKCINNIVNNGKNIFIDGVEIYKNKDKLRDISFVMSEDFLYEYMTVEENINFFRYLFDENDKYVAEVNRFCEETGIKEYKNALVKTLSQGTRNKLYLAIMLSKKHRILILDEPFTALDKHTQEIIINKVTQYKKTSEKCVIVVTHIEEFKQIVTRKFKL